MTEKNEDKKTKTFEKYMRKNESDLLSYKLAYDLGSSGAVGFAVISRSMCRIFSIAKLSKEAVQSRFFQPLSALSSKCFWA